MLSADRGLLEDKVRQIIGAFCNLELWPQKGDVGVQIEAMLSLIVATTREQRLQAR